MSLNESTLKAIQARVLLIDGQFETPKESKEAFGNVRAIFAKAAQDLSNLLVGKDSKVAKVDAGRLIHALDLLQQAKDTACVSLLLPYADTDPRVKATA